MSAAPARGREIERLDSGYRSMMSVMLGRAQTGSAAF